MQESADSRITTTSRAGQRCDTIGIGCLAGDDNTPPHRQERCGKPQSLQARPLLARCKPASHRAVERVGGFQHLEASLYTLRHPRDSDDVNNSTGTLLTCLSCLPVLLALLHRLYTHASASAHKPHYTATKTSKRLFLSPHPAGTSGRLHTPSADQWLSSSHQPTTAYRNVP
jgi:hypothetical protein